ASPEASEEVRRGYESRIADLIRQKEQLEQQLATANREIESLRRALSDTREQVNSDVMEQIRQQYDSKIQDMIQQKTQLAQELEAATALLQTERSRFAAEFSQAKPDAAVAPDGLE